MTWLDKLERRFGFLGIPGLIRIVVGFTALVFLLVCLNPGFRFVLDLDPARIRHGEVWRLVTYIFLPQTAQSFWVFLLLWFLWFIGEGLEHAWGAFRLTLYFVVGMIGTTVAAFFFGAQFFQRHVHRFVVFRFRAVLSRSSHLHPFSFCRSKIKWLAWVSAAFLLLGFVLGTNSYRMALIAAFANYFIFFGPEIIHQRGIAREVSARRQTFRSRFAQRS